MSPMKKIVAFIMAIMANCIFILITNGPGTNDSVEILSVFYEIKVNTVNRESTVFG